MTNDIATKFEQPPEAKENVRRKDQIVAAQAADGMDEFVARERAARERKESGVLKTQGNTDQFGRLILENTQQKATVGAAQSSVANGAHENTSDAPPAGGNKATPIEAGAPSSRVFEIFGIRRDAKSFKESGIGQPFTFDILKEHGEAKSEGDSSLEKPHQPGRDEIVAPERRRLEELAEKKLKDDPQALEKFKQDIEAFAIRTEFCEPKLPPEEVAKTYKEIARLMEAQGDKPTVDAERLILTQQAMHLAAFPSEVNQGNHGTCNVATVEGRLYTRNPSAVVHLVAEVAIKGEYTTTPAPPAKGVTVKPNEDSLHPMGDSASHPPKGSSPAYASRIFQVTAANIAWERSNERHPGQRIRYEQHEPVAGASPADSGDRLVDYSDPNNPKVVMKDGRPKHGPDINVYEIVAINSEISGQAQDGCVLTAQDKTAGGVEHVSNEQELRDKLVAAKQAAKLPITIMVHTGKAPIFQDSDGGKAGGAGGWHVVNITDYQEGTPPTVRLDNSWGSQADHVTDDRMLSVSSVFRAMSSPYQDLTRVHEDLEGAGKHDTEIELRLLQMEKDDGTIKGPDYEKKLAQIVAVSDLLWKETLKNGLATPELIDERRRAIAAEAVVMKGLSPAERKRVHELIKKEQSAA